MPLDFYDSPSGPPVIIIKVKQGHNPVVKTADELMALFEEAGGFSCVPDLAMNKEHVKDELFNSYLDCHYALRALNTRRVEEVAARFLIMTRFDEGRRDYHETWGQVRVSISS